MKLTLPPIYNTIPFTGSKNLIRQFIRPVIEINGNIVDSGDKHIVVESNERRYYITSDKDARITTEQYALLSTKRPTRTNGIPQGAKLQWLRHPLLKTYQVDEIRSSWKNAVTIIEEDPVNNINGLREPQAGAIYAILAHWRSSEEMSTVVLPTGTGKTETMLVLLVKQQCKKLLVIVPSDSLRDQISDKFLHLGLLKRFKILDIAALYPKVGILREGFNTEVNLKEFLASCNVVVTTMNLAVNTTLGYGKVFTDEFSHVFVDEAHHMKAESWNAFSKNFSPHKITQFTATPFRNDLKRLDGKIVFNFPLKRAQQQGYFKKINFIPVKEYDKKKADIEIANKAVNQLRMDIQAGYNHILMARCESKVRADEIYELYKEHRDLNPVKVYTGAPDFKSSIAKVKAKTAKIIVCVNMLGEGFDLPELKVAAFHDIRKSLPVTLQLTGRFTRTKYDEELGDASIIANIKDVDVQNELEELYAQDSDWNTLLPTFSSDQIEDEVGYQSFISEFKKLAESKISFQNLRPSLSTVVYKNKTDSWNPSNFKEGMTNYEPYDYLFHDINRRDNVLLIITAQKIDIEWGKTKDAFDILWNFIIVYWETKHNLLFIHGEDKRGNYRDIAEAVIGNSAELVDKIDVYKVFHDVKRVKLQNIGLKEFLGKNMRFRMSAGSDLEPALTLIESQRATKAFAFGVGFENGDKVSIGCSSKGRIWSRRNGDIKEFTEWCKVIATKVSNDSINPNTVLRDTLIPRLIVERPAAYPLYIDWDEDIYLFPESKITFTVQNRIADLSVCTLELVNPSDAGDLTFAVKSYDWEVQFKLNLFRDGDDLPSYKIVRLGQMDGIVTIGSKQYNFEEFFTQYIPTIWFADGSSLTGNELFELKSLIGNFSLDNVQGWDWTGVDLTKESQGVDPKITDSIQYHLISKLSDQDYDVIYDDDYSGEIADVIAIKKEPEKLSIKLFHLKFAIEGKVTNQIKNFYEVCGQAQKCIHWKYKPGHEFFGHLLRRETKKLKTQVCSRLNKGTRDDLEHFERLAKRKIPMEFEVIIVQPGLSKRNTSEDILTLLGVTENYLREVGGIRLSVIASS